MGCLKLPTIPIPVIPSPFSVGVPGVSLSAAVPAWSVTLPCCNVSLPSAGISISLPPLGPVSVAIEAGLAAAIGQINNYIRAVEASIACPF